ncbi:MAG: DUF4143 domain-containing protein [Candidatus Xenobiia bacterium LiM19]
MLNALKDKLFSGFAARFSLTSFYKQYKDSFPISKDSLSAYYRYFLESGLVLEARILSDSSYKRTRNPAKVYLADTGLAKRILSPDAGRLLENLVFLELRRRGNELFYFSEAHECDFVAKKDGIWSLYQVTYRLDNDNREREIAGLSEAAMFLGLSNGTILTFEDEGQEQSGDVKIEVLPAWKWLISLH